MPEPPPRAADRRRLERRAVAAMVSLIVLARSLLFLVWGTANFDSDQAVFGLMAKHLSELRAFPVFMYGQNYILAVEAWAAAPLFAVAGPSIAALKLPLLAANIAIALLLLRLLERDTGLRPLLAAVPVLFLALPAPGTAALFLQPSGGNVEPMLYVLLVWTLKDRPNWCGLVLGIGFLHREFTVYGLVALLAIDGVRGALLSRAAARRYLAMLRTAAEIWLVAQVLKQYASAAGPGTSVALVQSASTNLGELVNRICLDPATLVSGLGKLATEHWPVLWGTRVTPLADVSIESAASQGIPGATLLAAATLALAVVGILVALVRVRRLPGQYDVCVYLILVGVLSTLGYVAGRCGDVAVATRRYELMSLLAVAGLGALFLLLWPARRIAAVWIAMSVACAAVSLTGHARLWIELATGRPIGQKEQLVRQLHARGIEYGYADYWVAYYVSFLTNERIVLASDDFVRIKEYESIVAEHKAEAFRISRHHCDRGRPLVPGYFFLCPL